MLEAKGLHQKVSQKELKEKELQELHKELHELQKEEL
jgi:hypothetical protein